VYRDFEVSSMRVKSYHYDDDDDDGDDAASVCIYQVRQNKVAP